MDIANAKRLLDLLVENAARILRAGFGLDCTEPTFFQIVELLRSQPGLKDDFLAKIEYSMSALDPGALDIGMLPKELIELVAHELRWTEILSCAERRVDRQFAGDRQLAIGDIAISIEAAFNDNWADREFYGRYSAPTQSAGESSSDK